MEIRRYFHLFRSQWWLVLLSTLVCGGAAYVVSTQVLAKSYSASARFEVNIPVTQGLQAPSTSVITATDADLLTSYRVAQGAIDQLHLGRVLSAAHLRSLTTCTPSEFAQTIDCSLDYRDPRLAAELLNAIGKVAIEFNRQNQTGQLRPLLDKVNSRLTATENDLAAAQQHLASARGQAQTVTLTAQIEADNTAITNLQLQQVQLQELLAAQSNSIIPIDTAQIPSGPSSPRPLRNSGLALLVGFLLGVGTVLGLDYLDDSPRGPADVARTIGAPILSSVPRVERPGELLEILANPRSNVAEAYRTMRTNLQFANVDTPLQVLLVTSAQQGDGKTTTAANLAVSCAEAGMRVVLLDGDLRRPGLQRVFSMDNRTGLINLLLRPRNETWIDTVREGPRPGLHVLTTGPLPPNPSEMLASKRMHMIMDDLRSRADLVIVDSPPVLAVADALVLAKLCDAVLVVADVERSRLHLLKQATDALASIGVSICGVALNKVTNRWAGYYDYYAGNYYFEYGYSNKQPDKAQKGDRAASGTG